METYHVKPGDSLSKISQLKYGDFSMVNEIAKLNNISNINLIMPGQVLRLPEVQEVEVTVIDQNGNTVSTTNKKNWLPYLLGGLLVAGGIYYVMNRKKKGKKVLGLGSTKKKTSEKFKNLKYEPSTQTIRTVPENYWIATIKNGKIIFDSWDGAIKGRVDKSYVKKWFKDQK